MLLVLESRLHARSRNVASCQPRPAVALGVGCETAETADAILRLAQLCKTGFA